MTSLPALGDHHSFSWHGQFWAVLGRLHVLRTRMKNIPKQNGQRRRSTFPAHTEQNGPGELAHPLAIAAGEDLPQDDEERPNVQAFVAGGPLLLRCNEEEGAKQRLKTTTAKMQNSWEYISWDAPGLQFISERHLKEVSPNQNSFATFGSRHQFFPHSTFSSFPSICRNFPTSSSKYQNERQAFLRPRFGIFFFNLF